MKELSAEASYWLSEDLKRTGKLLFKDCLIKVNKTNIAKYDIWASFVDAWEEIKRTDYKFHFLPGKFLQLAHESFEAYAPELAIAEEIELAIVKVLWERRLWPESLFYDGREVTSYFVTPEAKARLGGDRFGFVYFIRNKDLYKIGITTDMLRRMAELKPDELLNMVRCSNYFDVESTIHKEFSKERLPQSEYFRLSLEQIEKVHQMMLNLAST